MAAQAKKMEAAEEEESRMQHQTKVKGLEAHWTVVGVSLLEGGQRKGAPSDQCPSARVAMTGATHEDWSPLKMGSLSFPFYSVRLQADWLVLLTTRASSQFCFVFSTTIALAPQVRETRWYSANC